MLDNLKRIELLLNKKISVASGLLTVGSILLAYIPFSPATIQFSLIIIASAIVLFGSVILIWGWFSIEKVRKSRLSFLSTQLIKVNELDEIYELIAEYSGGSLVPKDRRETIYNLNKEGFILIVESSKIGASSNKLGIIILYPLRKSGVEFLLQVGTTGGQLKPLHISRTNGRPSGCHIAFVWGDGNITKAKCINVLNEMISRWSRKTKSSFYVFARPTTEEALRALKRRGFKPRDTAQRSLGSVYVQELTK